MVLTAYGALSPVIGLCCHRRRNAKHYRHMPASRHQDHTLSPSASPVFAKRLRRAKAPFVFRRLCVHRIPAQRFVTTAKRPSYRAGMAGASKDDLPDGVSEIFLGRGVDGGCDAGGVICPSGK